MPVEKNLSRRGFAFGLGALVLAGPARGDTDEDTRSILRQLREQGYQEIRVSRTWLGRVRIVADRADSTREIVYNPATRVLMRDYTTPLASGDAPTLGDPGRPSAEGGAPGRPNAGSAGKKGGDDTGPGKGGGAGKAGGNPGNGRANPGRGRGDSGGVGAKSGGSRGNPGKGGGNPGKGGGNAGGGPGNGRGGRT